MRIFVIDDEVDVAETLGDIVAELGHQPSLVHTAKAALAALELEAPDAILLDIRLPGMDGLEFVRRRRAQKADAPVIGISRVATDVQMWECLRLGALDFARKPLTLELLADLVRYVEAHRPGRDIGGRSIPNRTRRDGSAFAGRMVGSSSTEDQKTEMIPHGRTTAGFTSQ